MDCGQTSQHLGPYVDAEAAPEVCRAVEAHVAECAACRAELAELRALAESLAHAPASVVPGDLWPAIAQRLDDRRDSPRTTLRRLLVSRRTLAIAATVVAAVGLGLFSLPWTGNGVATVEAETVDFGPLLDRVHVDPQAAFESFLAAYAARPITAADARRSAPKLRFDLPDTLPGGFDLQAVYALRFGDQRGLAARYTRGGEFLAIVLYPPALREQYGAHKSCQCTVCRCGGQCVSVGDWSLVHLTDASTCHCVLSRLDENTELPAVMAAVSPAARQSAAVSQEGHTPAHEH